MGGWVQTSSDGWQWSADHDFGEQKTWPRNKWPSEYHKGKKIMEPELKVTAEVVKVEAGRTNTGRLKVGTTIEFVKYPEKGPNQMMSILNVLDKDFQGSTSIGLLWQKLEGVLITRQSVDRIYKHYHREMVDKGYIRILS